MDQLRLRTMAAMNTFPMVFVGGTLAVSVLRSVIIPVAFETIRRTMNPDYSRPACLLKMVNETVPAHYQAHPFYSGLKAFSPNEHDDCDLQQYVDMQYNQCEHEIFQACLLGMGLWAIWSFVQAMSQRPNALEWHPLLLLLLSYVVSQVANNSLITVIMMSYAHFAQDIVFLCGNIMHHCDISSYRVENNASLVKMTPHGFALTSLLTIVWGVCLQHVIVRQWPVFQTWYHPSWIGLQTWISLLNVIFKVKTSHPLMHAVATKDMLQAPVWTFEWRAAQHVFVHHGNGDAFGPSFLFDPIFSQALHWYGYLHNDLGGFIPGTVSHYIFAIAFDVSLGCLLGLLLAAVYAGCYVLVTFLFQPVVKCMEDNTSTLVREGWSECCRTATMAWLAKARRMVWKKKVKVM